MLFKVYLISHGRQSPLLTAVKVGLGLVVIGGLAYCAYKFYSKEPIIIQPLRFRRVGKLQSIGIYPVKSCAPITLKRKDNIHCDVMGLSFNGIRDRTLMLIDENNQMVTGRDYSKMVLIQPDVISFGQLVINAPDMEELAVDFEQFEKQGQEVSTEVWGTPMKALLCGPKYDEWFSWYLLRKESGLRLVYYIINRPVWDIVSHLRDQPNITKYDRGSFNDATSYMLMNLASVEDLSVRLHRPVNPNQFRGSFYLRPDSDTPYVEDNWKWVRIGEHALFQVVGPCTRDVFTTVNVETGERDSDGEPFKILRSFRQKHQLPLPVLGIQMGLRNPAVIRVNEVIYVVE